MMTHTLHRLVVVLVLAAAAVVGAGCDGLAGEKAAIRKCVKDLEAAYDNQQGHAAAELVTQESLDHFGKLLKVALDGKRDEVERLPPVDRLDVLYVRHRSSRKSLKGLDGRGFQVFTTDQGWWIGEDRESITRSMGRLTIDSAKTSAWCPIMEDGKATAHRYEFKKVNGAWKMNELTSREYFNAKLIEAAKVLKMSVNDFLIVLIEDESDEPVKPKLWDPMPK